MQLSRETGKRTAEGSDFDRERAVGLVLASVVIVLGSHMCIMIP